MHGGFRLYSQYSMLSDGGGGLVRVRATIQEETAGLQEYIKKISPTDDLLGECLRQLRPSWRSNQGVQKDR